LRYDPRGIHVIEGRNSEQRNVFRNPLLYTTAVLVIALLYTGWIFWSRREANLAFEQRLMEQQRERDARTVEMMGGGRFEILDFYAAPGVIARGETAQICYGVSNAKSVQLTPPAGPVWPSYGRCVDVSPAKNTTYTLTAEDAAGHTQTTSVTLHVR
jgi:hypothetical protein